MSNVQGFLGQIENDEHDDLSFIDGLNNVDDLLDVVDGLGRVATRRRTPARARTTAVRGAAKAASRAKTVRKTAGTAKGGENENELTSLQTMMENRIPDIRDKAVQADLASGNLTVVDGEIYSCKKAVADTKLIEPKDSRVLGVRNINKAQLDSGSVMLVTHIAIESGITTGTSSSEDLDALDVEYVPVSESTDKTLLRAEFNLLQNRKPLQVNMPVASFLHDQTNEPRGFMRLKRPILIQNAEDIDCRVIAPDGRSFATGTYLQVRFKGGITVPRGIGVSK